MRRPALLLSSAILFPALVACGRSTTTVIPGPAPAAFVSPLGDDSDCNLATPLTAGIPGSPGHLIPSPRNPNGDSELAVLMRRFVDDVRNARALVEAGQPVPKMFDAHRRMRCSWLTKPEERDARFDTMAQSYLVAVKAFDAAPAKDTYNGVVAGCIACHSQSCGGPLDFLDTMKWQ